MNQKLARTAVGPAGREEALVNETVINKAAETSALHFRPLPVSLLSVNQNS